MDQYIKVFFESYNAAQGAAYDKYLDTYDSNSAGDDGEEKLYGYLQEEYKKWVDTPQEPLGGKTPTEFLEDAGDFDTLISMFAYGAVVCDDELPEVYLDTLKGYGEPAVDALLDIAVRKDDSGRDEGFLVPLMAIRLLGEWKVGRAVLPVIALLEKEEEAYDLLLETVRDALLQIGEPALDGILTTLNAGSLPHISAEYLIMALADIGKNHRSDLIYQQLKKAFIQMPQKIIAANCLGNYGDGRAVPVLRGFLERNRQQLDRETFYEIVSVIKRLGGRIDDLGTPTGS